MNNTNATFLGRMQNAFRLLGQMFLNSGLNQWTDEKLKSSPAAALRLNLFLTSFIILFFELACIRLLPAHVRLLGYFMNFILLASFLGIGVGILSARHKRLWLPSFPLMLFIMLAVVAFTRKDISLTSTEVLYYGAGDTDSDEAFYVLPLLFTLVALSFVPLSRSLGRLLTGLPPLQAYAIDICGSLAGIALFFFMSLLSLPPIVWFGLLCIPLLLILPRKELLMYIPLLVGSLYIVYWVGADSLWSPYYRMKINEKPNGGYIISVNNMAHQQAVHYEDKEVFYFRIYELLGQKPFKRALILGAGSGSDVAIALANGVEHVDAVEIDPLIYRLGTTLNPDKPYSDPRVQVYVEDGRTFLRNTTNKYDLIIYALPDSVTLTSAYSSLRLESFLLTQNSIAEASRLLTDDGALVLYNYYRQDWLIHKLAGMVESVFQSPPFVTTYGDAGRAAIFIAGPRLADLPEQLKTEYSEEQIDIVPGQGFYLPVIGQGLMHGEQSQHLATDDWPFVYLPFRSIPSLYTGALAMVFGIALVMLVLVAPRTTLRRFDWHFFFLGAAFMLLETRSLVTFALLFGSTWMVNSLVFFAILASVLFAILFNARFKVQRVWPLYVLLFTILIINFVIPQQVLLSIPSPVLRYTLASLLTFLPIFLANIVFSRSFRDTEQADISFGSNLIGSMAGGVFEYMALASGYQSLLILVIAFYAIAYFFWRRIGQS